MRRELLFSDIPDREDRGTDYWYPEGRAVRGLCYGLVLSAPIWALIACAVYFFTH